MGLIALSSFIDCLNCCFSKEINYLLPLLGHSETHLKRIVLLSKEVERPDRYWRVIPMVLVVSNRHSHAV